MIQRQELGLRKLVHSWYLVENKAPRSLGEFLLLVKIKKILIKFSSVTLNASTETTWYFLRQKQNNTQLGPPSRSQAAASRRHRH